MRALRCTLISNPASGTGREDRLERIHAVASALSAEGHSVTIELTTGPGSASAQAREAVGNGAEVVFACGGDGTVHEVIQGLVSENATPGAALGIVPLGSANALARHLKLPLDAANAAMAQVRGGERTIPVGKLECEGRTRYFTVMAGAGPDGALVYNMLTGQKSLAGRLAYYRRAAMLFATRRFSAFEVGLVESETQEIIPMRAVCAMALRVSDLGGLFRGLTGRGGSLEQEKLQLLLVRPPAMIALPLWFVSSWLGLRRFNPMLKTVLVSEFCCNTGSGAPVHVEADGEWIGRGSIRVSIVPNALRIRMAAAGLS